MTFQITGPGIYRNREEETVIITREAPGGKYTWRSTAPGRSPLTYNDLGQWNDGDTSSQDIVELIRLDDPDSQSPRQAVVEEILGPPAPPIVEVVVPRRLPKKIIAPNNGM